MKKLHLLIGINLFATLCFSQPVISTFAGNGTAGTGGDGGPATSANLYNPNGVAVDGNGNIYIANVGLPKVRKVNTSGVISTVAGNGTYGYSGDGGPATSAQLQSPFDVAFDPAGNLYIADANNHVIRKVTTSGIISTYAGTGAVGSSGDGGAATSATLNAPEGICFSAGNLYIVDRLAYKVRMINSSGIISTVAGNGTQGFSGDGGAATSAQFAWLSDIIVDGNGNLFIGDYCRVRKVNTSGVISTIYGTTTQGCTGNGGPPSSALLNQVSGLALDSYDNLFISDVGCNQIRQVSVLGTTITAFAGTGSYGFGGDGGPAVSGQFSGPLKICFDNNNNLYICDIGNNRIRKVTKPYCVASVGQPTVSGQNTSCCGCSTTGVQIGTPAISGLTYSWSPSTNLNSTTIAQPISTWCNVSTPKVYTLTVTASNCATATSTATVSTTPYGGINCCRLASDAPDETEQNSLVVFPNPASGNVTVSLSENAEYLQITDVMGRIVSDQRNLTAGQLNLDVSCYEKGTYFIIVNMAGRIERESLIIE